LPEIPPLFDELTVGEQLGFIAGVRGVNRIRIGEVLELLGLIGWEKKPIKYLSKGYRQRVGLAQAILHRPKILVLDEPMSGLDPIQIIEVRSLIKSVAEQHTVILSTHVLSEIDGICDRLLIIDGGRSIASTSVKEFKENADQCIRVKMMSETDPTKQIASIDDVSTVSPLGSTKNNIYEMVLKLTPSNENKDQRCSQLMKLLSDNTSLTVIECSHFTPSLEEIFVQRIKASRINTTSTQPSI